MNGWLFCEYFLECLSGRTNELVQQVGADFMSVRSSVRANVVYGQYVQVDYYIQQEEKKPLYADN